MPQQPIPYRPDIDGLRAVAILLVVAFHAFPDLVPGGFVGVDVFFVISGFLISGILIGSLERGSFSFREFYARRIRRIFPALILVLSACFVLGWFALLPHEFLQLGKHMVGGASFSSNFVLWGESGYFDNASETKPLLHLWSLAVEEQFYLVWPALVWFAWKRKFNLLHVAVAVCLGSFAWNIAMLYQDATYTFYSPQTRLWELMAGAILASLQWRNPPPQLRWRRHASYMGAALLAVAAATLARTDYFPGWWALMPVLGAVLVILAGSDAWLNRALLARPFMAWVGKISYPLYLWHWPLLSFATIAEMGTPSASIRTAAVLLATALAWLTYRLVEQPVRAGRVRRASRALAGLMAVVLLAGATAYSDDGVPARQTLKLSAAKYDSALYWMRNFRVNDACKRSYPELAHLNDCLKAKQTAPTIVLIGDSHSNNLYPGLAEATAASRDNVMNAAAWACPPFFHTEVVRGGQNSVNSCMKRTHAMLDHAIASKSIETIVVAARWPFYFNGTGYGTTKDEAAIKLALNHVEHPELTDVRAVFKLAMREMLGRLAATNKHIIFVLDQPELGFDPKSCVFGRPLSLSTQTIRQPCAIPREDFDKRNGVYRAAALSVLKAFPSVVVFDAAKFFCDDKWCWAMRDGELLYRDDDHLSLAGSRYLAPELMKLIHPADSGEGRKEAR